MLGMCPVRCCAEPWDRIMNHYYDPPSEEELLAEFGATREELALMGASKWSFEISRMDIRDCWGAECFLCEKPVLSTQATKEHVIPRSLGGPTIISNLRYAHEVCNTRKGSRILPDLEVSVRRRKELKAIWVIARDSSRKHYEGNPGNGRRTPWVLRIKGPNTW